MLVMMFVVAEVGGGRGSVPGDATQEHHTADREQGLVINCGPTEIVFVIYCKTKPD